MTRLLSVDGRSYGRIAGRCGESLDDFQDCGGNWLKEDCVMIAVYGVDMEIVVEIRRPPVQWVFLPTSRVVRLRYCGDEQFRAASIDPRHVLCAGEVSRLLQFIPPTARMSPDAFVPLEPVGRSLES